MKNRVTILLACSLLFAGAGYSCSSPPAYTQSVHKTETISKHLPVSVPMALTATPEFMPATVETVSLYTLVAYVFPAVSTDKYKNVSMAAYGHAIRLRVSGQNNSTKLNSRFVTSCKHLHIDPGLRSC